MCVYLTIPTYICKTEENK